METKICGLRGDRLFFTSDTHFYHTNIMRYYQRPFDTVQQMNESLIENWSRVVEKDDVVFHFGDFSFGDVTYWNDILDRLNGKIYLVVDNRDLKNMRPSVINLFECVDMQMYIEVEKQPIDLNHNLFLCYGGSYDGTWQLFDYVHTRENTAGQDASRLSMLFPTQYDVGVDNNCYTPVSIEQVRNIINSQIQKLINVGKSITI